jgi:transcriptional regulator with XRE-family HTH domain
MNIKDDIQRFLKCTGMSAAGLARQAGISAPVITRILSGERKGLHSSTLEKLSPFLYGPDSPIVLAMETADQVLEQEEARHGS